MLCAYLHFSKILFSRPCLCYFPATFVPSLSYNSCQLDLRYPAFETEICNYMFEILGTYLKAIKKKKEKQQNGDKPKLKSRD